MTADEAGFLSRPDLPEGFERWTVSLAPGGRRRSSAAEWAGALVRVEAGTVEVACTAGGHETFHAGDLLALGWLPIVELRNRGDGPVTLVAVRRRDRVPVEPHLHVTHDEPGEKRRWPAAPRPILAPDVRNAVHHDAMSATLDIPARLAPFLAQWDYFAGVLFDRLAGMTDEEYVWEPTPETLSVRIVDGRPVPDALGMDPDGSVNPPRTIAWSVGHLAAGSWERADYLVGEHRLTPGELTWPVTAAEGIGFLREGLGRWRDGLATMSDADLDTVGRSAFPWGLDPELPLIEIVWWVNKELIYHASEIWLLRDLYHARVR